MQGNIYRKIAHFTQTVFSFKELILILQVNDTDNLKSKLNYFVRQGDLYHIRRGLYAKSAEYNHLELAVKIFTPAYISFETVLVKAGIIFQHYSQIFVACYQSRELICDGSTYTFRALKPAILTNTQGVHILDTYCIASPERAFLDVVYHTKNYYFDNLEPLDWQKVYAILPIYGDNKSMRIRVDKYYQDFKDSLLSDSKKEE